MSLPNKPQTRKEMYLSNMAGQGTALPSEPHTREEEYLDYIAKNGGGGGTGEGDMTKAVYDDDLAVASAGGIADYVAGAITGKVDKVQGKGLSTNDYDDSAKAIVDGVTTELDGKADQSDVDAILNGTNIDSFGDVETALATKVDKVTGKGLSTNDYDDTEKAKVASAVQWADAEGYVGKNLFSKVGYRWNPSGEFEAWPSAISTKKIAVTTGEKFRISKKTASSDTDAFAMARYFDSQGAFLSSEKVLDYNETSHIITISSGISYMAISQFAGSSSVMTQALADSEEYMICDNAIPNTGYEPYIPNNTELFPRSEQAVLGAKNLLTPNLSGYIPGGLTVTNDNGVLTINGTLASQDNIILKPRVSDGVNYQYLPKGSYTFDCKGSSGSYRVFVGTTYNGSYAEWGAGSSVTFTIDDNTNSDYKLSDGSVLVGFWATIPANTYNNEKLYPLLTVAGDTDRTFAPYAMTNKELTEKVIVRDTLSAVTLAENVNYYSNEQTAVYKIGDLKIISILLNGITLAASTWMNLATLSSEMKPRKVFIGIASMNGKTDEFDVQITTDNLIRIRNNSGAITSTDIVKVYAVYV